MLETNQRQFECRSCQKISYHDWFSLCGKILANLPLAIENQVDVERYITNFESLSNDDESHRQVFTKMLSKNLFFGESSKDECISIPNLNLSNCRVCEHLTLWFGRKRIIG